MARMSRKELEKRVKDLEKAVFNLATMHNTIPSELAKPFAFGQRMPHPKSLVAQNPVKTSYGWVNLDDLVQFVVDKKPLRFKETDKEVVTELHPDGTEVKKIEMKERNPKTTHVTMPPYGEEKSSYYLTTEYWLKKK